MTSTRSTGTDLPTGTDVSEVVSTIGGIAHRVLGRDVDPAVDLFDQGATSLAFIRMVAEVGTRYGVTVDVAELEEARIDLLSQMVVDQVVAQERDGREDGR
jgi:acyl carrier protein